MYQVIFPWSWSGRSVKLTTHLHLVPRSRMHGAIPPLHQHAFMNNCFRNNYVYLLCIWLCHFISPANNKLLPMWWPGKRIAPL
jgi:hypothetical protein